MSIKELQIPVAVGFCKNCFRDRRNGSAYCGQCKDELERMKIYISDERFPLLHRVMKTFGFKNDADLSNVVFTYGDTIYASDKTINDLTFHLIAHEITHVFQQTKMGKDLWWGKYLKSKKFRLEQELEAYRQQYRVAKNKGANVGDYVLEKTAQDLSGRLYGNMIDFDKAKDLIKG